MTATHTRDENRAFIVDIREEARLVRWEARFMGRYMPDLAKFPAVAEVCDVALWHAVNKPARHWLHTGPIRAREAVLHDAGTFNHRGETWTWRLTEQSKPAGLLLEVRGHYAPRSLPVIARMPWSVNDAAA